MGNKLKEKLDSDYKALGLTIFSAGAALILLYMILRNLTSVSGVLGQVVSILSPFIYGIVIAYLLTPVYDFVTRKTYARLKRKFKKHPGAALPVSKALATFVSVVVLFATVAAFGFLVIPAIIDSVTSLVEVIPEGVTRTIDWLEATGRGSDTGISAVVNWLEHSSDNITEWLRDNLLPELGEIASHVYAGLWGTVKTVLNILVGVIASAYMLNGRERFKAQFKKAAYAVMTTEHAENVIEFVRFSNKKFGGFISGKILDSIIIGFLCYGLMIVLGLPYAVLVSFIIGVTNVIPFFGPFIGAVPGFLIIFVVDPVDALIFAVMILGLQQFDGNILGPKILGDSIGIASFWVLFSIIIGGGLFGPLGMVLAVPTFAVFYYYFKTDVEKKLKAKGLAVETAAYEHTGFYEPDEGGKAEEPDGKQEKQNE